MGIGQEPSNSEVVSEEDNFDTLSEADQDHKTKTLSEAELELELAGKPWPVASRSFVISVSLCLLSLCLIFSSKTYQTY